MTQFSVDSIPGLRRLGAQASVDLPVGSAITLQLATAAPALGEGTHLSLSVTLDAAARKVTLAQIGSVALHGGVVELEGFELSLTYQGAGAAPLQTLVTDGVSATGTVQWSGGSAIGLADPLALELAYEGGAFHLRTPAPLQWPAATWSGLAPTVQLDGGASVSVKPRAADASVLLTIQGQAGWVSGGPVDAAIDQVEGLVAGLGLDLDTPIAGTTPRDMIDQLGQGTGPLRITTRLAAGSINGWSFGFEPTTGLDPSALVGEIARIVRTGDGAHDADPLDLSLGAPAFWMGQEDTGLNPAAAQDWQLWFRQCELGFPQLTAIGAPGLQGELRLRADMVEFLPAGIQGIDLPEILRFLLARLQFAGTWIADSELWDLVEPFTAAGDWLAWFRGMLSDVADPVVLESAVMAAVAVLDPEVVFELLLQAIATFDNAAALDWAKLAWTAWDEHLTDLTHPDGIELALDVLARLTEFGRPAVQLLAEALASVLAAGSGWADDVARVLAHLEDLIEDAPDPSPLLRFAADLLTGFIRAVGGGGSLDDLPAPLLDFGRGLLDFLGASRDADWSVPGAIEPSGAAIQVTLPHWIAGQTLSAMALQVPGLTPQAGWRRLPDAGSAFGMWLGELGSQIGTIAQEFLRVLAALLEAATPDLTDWPKEAPTHTELQAARDGVRRERELIALVRKFPPITLPLLAIEIVRAVRRPSTTASYIGRDVTNDPQLATLRLPPPGTPDAHGAPRRYLIVSDVHRDCVADDKGALQFGSIDHFRDNRTLYATLLRRAIDEDLTVIEGGDCEELWFVLDPSAAVEHEDYSKLAHIISDNKEIYGLLWQLAAKGRYFRVFGNHDSYLRLWMHAFEPYPDRTSAGPWPGFLEAWRIAAQAAGVSASLDDLKALKLTNAPASPPIDWRPYDALVIDGVKTMLDQNALELLGDIGSGDEAAALLMRGRLGMDSEEYYETKPMIVTHGHQFDFWNCDANSLLGKMIANTAGVITDSLMDPLLDIRGVALGGRAMVDFRAALGGAPIANNFLDRHQSIQMAHAIQHQDDRSRLTIDDIYYSESTTVLVANFLMPLPAPRVTSGPNEPVEFESDPNTGELVLDPVPGWSNWAAGWNVNTVADALANADVDAAMNAAQAPLDRYLRFFMNHFCIGHTHTPQSQPYLTLPSVVGGVLSAAGAAAGTALDGLLPGAGSAAAGGLGDGGSLPLRMRYFNTGTSGWCRGVVWGLEVESTGTPRLTYFAASARGEDELDGPFYMDWELEPLPAEVRGVRDQLAADGALQKELQDIWAGVQQWWSQGFTEVVRLLGQSASLSLPPQAALLMPPPAGAAASAALPSFLHAGATSSPLDLDTLRAGVDTLHDAVLQAIVSLAQRAAGMAKPDVADDTFTVRVTLPTGAASALDTLTGLIGGLLPAGVSAPAAAGAVLIALQHLPFRPDVVRRADGSTSGFLGPAPLVGGTLALVNLLGGDTAFGDQELTADLVRDGNDIVLTLHVRKGS